MIQNAKIYQISDIFGIDRRVKYVVPKYQREYIWGKEQWENLFNDLLDNEEGYFLGSIICIDTGTDALSIRPLETIDGQQRLTTISLLFASIYDRILKESGSRSDDDFITEKNNLKYRLIQKTNKNDLKLELSYQNNNFEDYKSILAKIIYSISNIPRNAGNRRICKAYRYFKENLSDLDYDQTIKILNKVYSASLVKIEVNSHSDAFILFETLNNRGIPLSAIDLIKNKILSELEKKDIKSIDDAFDDWKKLVDNLPDYPIQERFLRQYYNAFKYNEKIKIEGAHRATRGNLIKIYEKLIHQDPEFIFDELVEKSKVYNLFVEPENDESNAYYRGLTDLLHIGAAPSYTFLLYLFTEHKNNPKLIIDSINFLVKYFVRRNLTDFPSTRDLDAIFIGLVDDCERNRDNFTSHSIINYLTHPERIADLNIFKEKLKGDIYEDNVAATRFILCKIDGEHQTKETHKNLWKRDDKNKKFIWTIEHIFPEGKNIPGKWVDMVANGDVDKANELQIAWVHKLGNLTMSGYNSNLSNLSFEVKRNRKDSKGNCIGYMNGLYLNEELARKNSWTIEDIESRTNKLVTEALELFKINDEMID